MMARNQTVAVKINMKHCEVVKQFNIGGNIILMCGKVSREANILIKSKFQDEIAQSVV